MWFHHAVVVTPVQNSSVTGFMETVAVGIQSKSLGKKNGGWD